MEYKRKEKKSMRRRTIKKTLSIVLTAAMIGTTYIPVAAEGNAETQTTTVEDSSQEAEQNNGTVNGTSEAETEETASVAAQADESQETTTVAQIGDQTYSDLQSAIDAAEEGATITVVADITIDKQVTVAAGKKITIDLNDHTVSIAYNGQIQMYVYGELSIKDSGTKGVLQSTINRATVHFIQIAKKSGASSSGKVILESGKIATKTGKVACAVYVSNGTFEMNGGSVETEDIGAGNGAIGNTSMPIYLLGSTSSLNLTAGTVDAKNQTAIYVGSNSIIKVSGKPMVSGLDAIKFHSTQLKQNEISGGIFNGKIENIKQGIISGGTFDQEPPIAGFKDGYSLVKDEDGRYTVATGYEAMAGTDAEGYISYATFNEAIEKAKDGDTVALRADINNFAGVAINKDLTIDFGAYTITGKKDAIVLKVEDANVTLKSSSKTGGINGGSGGSNVAVCVMSGADVTIDSGVYTVGGDENDLENSTIYVMGTGKVTINDGTFSSEKMYKGKYYVLNLQNSSTGSICVNGGTFVNFNPFKGDDKLGGNFVAEGCGVNVVTEGNDTTYKIDSNAKLQIFDINGEPISTATTIGDAIKKSETGQTIQLLKDLAIGSSMVSIYGKKVSIDLNNHNIPFKSKGHFNVKNGELELKGKGIVSSSVTDEATIYMVGSLEDVADYSVVNIGKDVTITNDTKYGLGIGSSSDGKPAYGAKLTVNGKVIAPYGFSVNGQIVQQTGNIPEVTINGEIDSTSANDSVALYAAGYAKYNINGKLTGVESALEIRAGILNIGENAELTATGDFTDPMPNGNGSTVRGVALAVSQHSTNLPIEINVAGGTFSAKGKDGHALYEIDTVKGDVYSENVQVNVTGGTFNQPIFSANEKFAISGGTFSEAVKSEYCALGYAPETTPNADGKYGVTAKDSMEATTTVSGSTSTATIGGKYNGKETDDVNNVATKEGTVIVDVTGESTADVTTSEIKVDKNSLSSLNDNKDVQKIIIQADAGTLDINKEALAKMTTDAKDSDVVLKLVKDQKDSGELYYHVTATANGEEIYTVNDPAGEVTISVSYEKSAKNCEPIVYYVNNEGTREKVTSTYDNGTLSWKTSHFSDYQITSGEAATITDGENTTTYETLAKAIEAATAEQTITLINDVNESGLSIAAGKNITIDLNGYTWTSEKSVTVDGGQLTVVDAIATNPTVEGAVVTGYKGGKITSANTTVVVINGGTLTIKSGLIESTGNCGVYANGNQTPGITDTNTVASTVVMNDGYVHSIEYGIGVAGRGAALTVNGGVIEAEDNAAVAGNGTNDEKRYDGGTTINITGGNLVGHIRSQGYIACGIYHPQKGTLNISGGTIYADNGVGILMRGGSMKMTGGKVIASGTTGGRVGDKKIDIAQCYGIYVDGSAGYYGATEDGFTTEITGGSVTADPAVPALNLSNKENDVTKGTIIVKAVEGKAAPTFSSTIDDSYCENNGQADGYYPVQDSEGKYTVDNTISTEFLGGSLRKDSDNYAQTSMRFGYKLIIPENITATWEWNYGIDKNNLSGNVKGVNYIQKNGYKISNIVVTGIPAENYETPIYSQLVVKYTTEAGNEYTYTDSIRERTVKYVADGIVADTEHETEDSIAYAKKLLEQIGKNE